MMLAIDAGNSRTKWGIFDDTGRLLATGGLDNAKIALLERYWRAHPQVRRGVLSCVGGETLAKHLEDICARLDLPLQRIRPMVGACGVRNGYADPQQLGSDRWAALVAAWQLMRGPCVVATAGTALTVDALSGEGVFLGGLIVPGYAMMRAALANGTAAVAPSHGVLCDFPTNTADAVHNGALAALVGAVMHVRGLLATREHTSPACLLAGGDAEMLAPMLAVEVVPDLVLRGLYLLGNAAA